MPAPIKNTKIVQQGLQRLTGAFRGQANITAWLTAVLQELQTLENATFDVYNLRQLRQATLFTLPQTNPILDTIGQLVGQARGSMSDADYQSALFLRIAVNRALGQIGDWSNFGAILLKHAGGPVYYLDQEAQIVFGVWNLALSPNVVALILSQAVPNGVAGTFEYSTWPDGNDFEFCDANNISTTGQGTFGDSVAGVVGGLLVSGAAI